MRATTLWAVLAALNMAACLARPALAQAELERGQQVFQRCASCHTLGETTCKMPGPSLHGVVGRRAGTLPGFDYSDAMVEAGRDRGLIWNTTTLFDYLDDTDAYVPGTAMGFLRIADPGDRKALIAYIEKSGG